MLIKCPHCLLKLSNLSLIISNSYPCYRCQKPITTGQWAIFIDDYDCQIIPMDYATELPEIVLKTMQHYGIRLKSVYSQAAGYKYLRQICPHCGSAQGDFYIEEYFAIPDTNNIQIINTKLLYCLECEEIFTKDSLLNNSQASNKCLLCNKTVSENIRKYCLSHQDLFKGMIYCFQCQRKIIN